MVHVILVHVIYVLVYRLVEDATILYSLESSQLALLIGENRYKLARSVILASRKDIDSWPHFDGFFYS